MSLTRERSITRATLLRDVPAFRPVAIQLLKLVEEPDVPLARVVSLLRTDPVLGAEMLGVANSPLFFRGSEIRSILHAVAILGLTRVKALVVTTSLRSTVDTRRCPLSLPAWRHSLTTAVVCEQLADAAGLPRDNCYTAGLIHDIGRLALLRAFPDYPDAMRAARSADTDILATERRLFGMDHAEAGRWLLGQWGCPIELQNVAAYHEDPAAAPARDFSLISLVCAASQMADRMGVSVFPSPEPPQLEQIVGSLPAGAREVVLHSFSQIADRALADVNGVELSLT